MRFLLLLLSSLLLSPRFAWSQASRPTQVPGSLSRSESSLIHFPVSGPDQLEAWGGMLPNSEQGFFLWPPDPSEGSAGKSPWKLFETKGRGKARAVSRLAATRELSPDLFPLALDPKEKRLYLLTGRTRIRGSSRVELIAFSWEKNQVLWRTEVDSLQPLQVAWEAPLGIHLEAKSGQLRLVDSLGVEASRVGSQSRGAWLNPSTGEIEARFGDSSPAPAPLSPDL